MHLLSTRGSPAPTPRSKAGTYGAFSARDRSVRTSFSIPLPEGLNHPVDTAVSVRVASLEAGRESPVRPACRRDSSLLPDLRAGRTVPKLRRHRASGRACVARFALQVPLADDGGLVSGVPRQSRKRRLGAVEAIAVAAKAVDMAVGSGEDNRPAWAADAVRAEATIKTPVLKQPTANTMDRTCSTALAAVEYRLPQTWGARNANRK